MSRFKPGDLAVVIGFRVRECFLGKTVELVRTVKPGEWFKHPFKEIENFSLSPEECWLCICGDMCALIAERHLMPLRGDFEPETETREVEVAV